MLFSKLFCYLRIPASYMFFLSRNSAREIFKLLIWQTNGFRSPAPNIVKWRVLKRYGGKDTWIESGTYLAETCMFISGFAKFVYTIEPSNILFAEARQKVYKVNNVEIFHGTSEVELPKILSTLLIAKTEACSFWLDGHYSFERTYKGMIDTPIIQELAIIGPYLKNFSYFVIFIDDVREFIKSDFIDNGYPRLKFLVDWAEARGFNWTIEHDIFIISSKPFSD